MHICISIADVCLSKKSKLHARSLHEEEIEERELRFCQRRVVLCYMLLFESRRGFDDEKRSASFLMEARKREKKKR